ncbi:hypothetical protein E2C01_022663 [Portunus trituberculatus]|uniref:Uncharacterized protein n=1 Tax=Portunus trituberculatus TaxID=210409 RepID=A0A5B7E8I7_PORTR|nr:hypothetical protein [Portunus trituberculatus]
MRSCKEDQDEAVCEGCWKIHFPHRMVEKWNALNSEVVTANNTHNFKEKLDKWRHGDRTL